MKEQYGESSLMKLLKQIRRREEQNHDLCFRRQYISEPLTRKDATDAWDAMGEFPIKNNPSFMYKDISIKPYLTYDKYEGIWFDEITDEQQSELHSFEF